MRTLVCQWPEWTMNNTQDQAEQLERELSEIANAVQAAGLLAGLHRHQCEVLTETTHKLEAALVRAVKALQRLQQ